MAYDKETSGLAKALARPTAGALAAVLATATLPACGLFGSDLERKEQADNLADCSGDADNEQVLDTILISEEYGDSLHEMIACGNLTLLLAGRIIAGVIEAIQAGSQGATPDGWSFDGGVYTTEATGVVMTLELFRDGQRLEQNVFLVESFLVGASASLQGDGSVEIEFESTGPLVELLGFGDAPESPLTVSLNDLNGVGVELGKLELATKIVVDDTQGETSVVHYELDSERQTISDILESGGIVYSLVEADATREDLEQDLTVREWEIDFVDHGVLDGYSLFDVTGDHFTYTGRISFDHSAIPERELECP